MSSLDKRQKTIIGIAAAVILVICIAIAVKVFGGKKCAYTPGYSGVVEQSGYEVEGTKYIFNTQHECYIKTDNYKGLKEIDVNFAEVADKDVILSLKYWDKDGNKMTNYINATWKKGTNYCRIPVDDYEKYSAYKIMIPHDFTLTGINFSSKVGGELTKKN